MTRGAAGEMAICVTGPPCGPCVAQLSATAGAAIRRSGTAKRMAMWRRWYPLVMPAALLGLRAKTGRAIAVVLSSKGEFLARREIPLSDPAVAGTAQPYHVVMEMPWSEAMVAVRDLVKAIERVATSELRALAREFDVR